RSKIENQGFNSQKNEGYNLEHAYSKNYNAEKCFYHLMQIAHIINQLMQHNSEIKQIIKKSGSLVNFYLELWEDFRNQTIDTNSLHDIMYKNFHSLVLKQRLILWRFFTKIEYNKKFR
ncbi:MAG: hypothetical protein KAT34_02710, partial [Candidatus Aminicenantes bacterium]|nr:hypothetical protein [Candidatus Aminicenantes bacterium]